MYYTQEQIDRANQADLVSFLQSQGEQLTRAGNEYRWKRHDSLTVRGNKWYRHSQSKGGGPVDFVMEFFGKSFTEAVELLTGEKGAVPPPDRPCPASLSDFRLPPPNSDNRTARNYLTAARRIDEDVTGFFFARGDIYEDAAHHNAVFVGRDEDGILNTINFKKSMHYNPFSYVHSEKDILKLVTTLMTNTKGEGSGGDPFWEKSERLLLTALIAYLHYEAPVEEQNFATLLEMLNTMQVLEDDEEYQNPVDLLFEELAKKKPNSFAGRQYKLYKLAAGKTAKSILISCGARLAPFDIQELRDLTMYDELQLDTLGDKKTALFLIMSDTDSTFNFLISMVYTQLFNLLCDKADDVYGGKLPIHVRCLIDECANIGQIPNLEKLVATIRSREISACLVLQARSQLKAIYKDNADTIVGNMDSQIFLGGSEPTTLKDLSEMLGKETIDAFNTSDTRGNSPSYGTTFQKMGHELLSRDELAVLDGGKCILQLRGVRPFLSDKYDLTQHPNYKLTSDYDPKNTFDIEKYLNRKEKINPNDEFVVIDADSLPSA